MLRNTILLLSVCTVVCLLYDMISYGIMFQPHLVRCWPLTHGAYVRRQHPQIIVFIITQHGP